ncbi:unnamed protein product [Paramecium sonneborni]|uniref:Uncharacterized protein n=1 Tax=Paramecium sonneborni TaxID=65129 RepID=A0A8S1PJY4_9CILI|nr:unnamed protein product [Paramecium sonneborni]
MNLIIYAKQTLIKYLIIIYSQAEYLYKPQRKKILKAIELIQIINQVGDSVQPEYFSEIYKLNIIKFIFFVLIIICICNKNDLKQSEQLSNYCININPLLINAFQV